MINVMTFNIYNWNRTDEHLRRICRVLLKNAPDTVGVQEITPEWIERIFADAEIAEKYGYIGVHRGDFTYEMTVIFYRKDKFKVVESGTKWYSKTPDITSTYGAAGQMYNRIFTYGVFERLSDGRRFAQLNTHLDLHVYTNESKERVPLVFENGELVQNEQARMLAEYGLRLKDSVGTVFLTGDFNATPDKYVHKHFEEKGYVRASDIAKETVGSSEGLPVCQGIDHVYILSDNPTCELWFTDGERYGEELKPPVRIFPSDHLPRMAAVKI